MRIRNGVVTAAIAALSIAGAAPVHASAAETDACAIVGPYYVEGAISCACIAVATIGQTVLPDSQWACP